MAPVKLAILDDYAGVAAEHFERLNAAATTDHKIIVDSYPTTLDPTIPSSLEALVDRLEGYDAISTMRERTPFPRQLLERLPKLKLLMTTSARNASIDMSCCAERGIVVTGTKGSPPPDPENFGDDLPPAPQWTSVNQHAWALLLALCSRIARDDAALKTDPEAWQSGMVIPLGGKTIGLLGLGKLGALMARTAQLGFGMRVVCWSASLTQAKADEMAVKHGCAVGEWKVVGSKAELMRVSDVVSLHYVLSERSRGMVGREELAGMKASAVLVNTSRGGLVDEEALVEVLREGRIRGAALDVFWREPLPRDSVWRGCGEWKAEVVLSPHMGYVNAGTIERWYQEQAEVLGRWVKGEEVGNRLN